jgi:hypothetical protein
VLRGEEVVSIKNTLIFIDYSTNFGGGGVELMLTASTNSLALDDGLDGPETVGHTPKIRSPRDHAEATVPAINVHNIGRRAYLPDQDLKTSFRFQATRL